MTTEELEATSVEPEIAEPTPAIPDYLTSPNAVFNDEGVQWRYGRPPDYSKTRKVWAEGKTMNHTAGSLPQLVENLVKNWEVEASFKPRLSDWRTIDHANYSFAMGGGPAQTAEHMIKVGTYNGIIAPNEYYSPENSDFNSSHKTFKRMMPTFAWEVLEVYSGPPRVSFRWRHWGVMKNDYIGFNNKGEKVTAKAHGGLIDIQGVTVADVDEKIRLQALQTWMDPLEMFRQIAPQGVVRKDAINRKVDLEAALDDNDEQVAPEHNNEAEAPGEVPAQMPASTESRTEPLSCPIFDRSTTVSVIDSSSSKTEGVDTVPATPGSAATSGHSGHPDQTSQSEACAIVEVATTYTAEVQIQEPKSNAPEVIQPVAAAPVPASMSDHILFEQTGQSIADAQRSNLSSPVIGNVEEVSLSAGRGEVNDASKASGVYDVVDEHLDKPAEVIYSARHEVLPVDHALASGPHSEETRLAHEEMSNMSAFECPFLQNRE